MYYREDGRLPTIMTQGSIAYRIYPGDHNPPHVHVIHGHKACVIEIKSGTVMANTGFKARDLAKIVATVLDNQDTIQEAWEANNG
jgi:hypothetical protein